MNEKIDLLVSNVEKVIIGKKEVIEKAIVALLCNGHILIDDVPGVGKTQLVYALTKSLDGKFNRIQLTPDIMPSDILGFSMIDTSTREYEYRPGAADCNFLLADEINRASPKVQSSLLEVMEEGQISLEGKTHILPKPFMVFATQNPVESYGTYHLPEAQMDRFIMKISIGYPSFDNEIEIINSAEKSNTKAEVRKVLSLNDIIDLQNKVLSVQAAPMIKEYILKIVSATRNNESIKLGASPRGSIALLKCAKAYAVIKGRDYVTPDDVLYLCDSVLAHRILLSPKGKAQYSSSSEALKDILRSQMFTI